MKDCCKIIETVNGFPWGKLFPDLLWIIFWITLLLYSRRFLESVITILINRLKSGSALKVGSFELESLKVTANANITEKNFEVALDLNNQRDKERDFIYEQSRGAMLVHKIFKSQTDGQAYDVLIYLIPHNNCNLIQIISVEYYFGRYWQQQIFKTADRSNGFAIATSAYGSFLCTAKINFNDGLSTTVYRYIDFEMGDVAAMIKAKD